MGSNVFRFFASIFSIIIIFIQHATHAASILDTRQAPSMNGPPAGWNFVGCYDDRGAARTLKAQSLVNVTGMTPALCLEFCSNFEFPYGFAGVEFGQECWCDGVIQLTANLTASSECNMKCKGDNTFNCGGSDRISIYSDGTPSPGIPSVATRPEPTEDATVVGLWQYIGCYSDNGVNRTLRNAASNGVQNDINSCVALCEAAYPGSTQIDVPVTQQKTLVYAGIEFGGECWCDTEISNTAERLPDIACASMGCSNENRQACGGEFTIAVYQYNPLLNWNDCELLPVPGPTENPFSTPFQLNAVFVDDPSISVPITMAAIIEFNNPWISIQAAGTLSHCPTCQNITFLLNSNSQWELQTVFIDDGSINNFAVTHPAGTANFFELTNDDRLFVGYCFGVSKVHPGVLELTAFGSHLLPPITSVAFNAPVIPDLVPFALCSNLTAGGRLDVVYKALVFQQAGYNLTNCRDVMLEMQFVNGTT